MHIDENQFFREATLRICGSLDIEHALWRSFMYIRDVIPADRMTLSFYDRTQGAIVIYASSPLEGGRNIGLKIPLAPEMEQALLDPNQFPDALGRRRAPSPSKIPLVPASSLEFSIGYLAESKDEVDTLL